MGNKQTQDMTGTGDHVTLAEEYPDGYNKEWREYENKVKNNEHLTDPEPERYYDWILWKMRQERNKYK